MSEEKKSFKVSKIKNTSDSKIGHLKVAVFGAAGTTKSRWSLNGSRNAVVVNLDKGLASVENGEEITSIDIDGQGTEIAVGVREAYDYVKENIKEYDLLVFDTYGAYTAALLKHFQENGDEKTWGMDFSSKLFETHKEWLDLPIDKVFIFHEEMIMNDNGVEKYAPAVSGGKFKEALPSYYDLVIRFSSVDETTSIGTCGDKKSIGKNRYLSRMPELEDGEVLFGSNGRIKTFQELRDFLDKKGAKNAKKK